MHCNLCAHRCRIQPGHHGICGIRTNIDGTLYSTTYGDPIALHIDPIEKKPLYHFLPGTLTYSIATIGCNFTCEFCQNWQISQRTQDVSASDLTGPPAVPPEEIVRRAIDGRCPSISFTYTEPTIFFEYAMDIARIAHDNRLKNIFVTNGYMTEEAIDAAAPWLDAANIDLKSFREEFYRKRCGGHVQPVKDSIRNMVARGIWVEVTTLLIPGENDSENELKSIAAFLRTVSADLPWHITRFHPDYRFLAAAETPYDTLQRAKQIGLDAGLRNVYIGNV